MPSSIPSLERLGKDGWFVNNIDSKDYCRAFGQVSFHNFHYMFGYGIIKEDFVKLLTSRQIKKFIEAV